MRPINLAEVSARVRDHRAPFGIALGEFLDTFYLAEDDSEKQACLDPAPDPTGDALVDAWLGAAGEHLAARWGLRVPGWTRRPCHFALERASFHPPGRATQGLLIVESPPAFRRRRLFVGLEPLTRARFPAARRATNPLAPPTAEAPLRDREDGATAATG